MILVVGKATGTSVSQMTVYDLHAKEKLNSTGQNNDVIFPMQFHRPAEFHPGPSGEEAPV